MVLGCILALAGPGMATAEPTQDAEATPPPAALAPGPAASPHRFYVRAGGALVKPMSSSREMELADVDGTASLAVTNGPIAGSGATVSSATIPAVTVGYVLPTESRRWSLETVLGVPFTVKFQATGTLADMSIAPTALGIPTGVGPLGSELGEAKAAPVVLTVVYQLHDGGVVRPYLGGGASVLFAYGAHVTNPMLTEVNQPEMTIAPAPGLVLQGGVEARLWRSVYARVDVKFIALMMARAEVRHVEVKTPGLPLVDNVEVGTAKMNVWVNPLIVQAGIGFDFDL
jgi:outer membrane protein W